MPNPTASFVIPCYKLAHLLPECIESILSQTYYDFEILILDDGSPDKTQEVARSFHDPRIRYIRNEQNLGHLRNYNKGICLSRGKYVWLISADDYLRVPYILERYVQLMEKRPRVGYVFCPGVGVTDGRETGVLGYSVHCNQDRIFRGHAFLKKLLKYNGVVAASAMARRECYTNVSFFPLSAEMGWSGDWYLWCVFALFFDVAYFAEPMVCYREHELSMTNVLTKQETVQTCAVGDIAVSWMVREKANEFGLREISKYCLRTVAQEYARHRTSKRYGALNQQSNSFMTIAEFEQSLCQNTECESERNCIRARVFADIGDILYCGGDRTSVRNSYLAALRINPFMARVHLKILLLSLGKPGDHLRTVLHSLRRLLLT